MYVRIEIWNTLDWEISSGLYTPLPRLYNGAVKRFIIPCYELTIHSYALQAGHMYLDTFA